jgi:hypothetical protein
MTKQRPRRARVLTNVRIDEISCVDAGAGEGVQIMLMKRASKRNEALAKATARLAMSVKSIISDDSVTDKNDMLAKSFGQFHEHLVEVIKNNSERAEPDLSNSDVGYGGRGRRQNEEDDDETERLSTDADDDDEQRKDKQMQSKFKSLDVVQICKRISDDGDAYSLDEHQLVDMIDKFARAKGSSFVAEFERRDEVGLALRKAVDVCKGGWSVIKRREPLSKVGGSTPHFLADGSVPTVSPGKATLKPRSSGFSGKPAQQGADNPRLSIAQLQALIDAQRAEADDDEAGEGGEHYEKLLKLAEQAHAAQPEQSVAQHFEKIYTSREHRELAMAERKANRPRA